jgi:hypothetical protein
MTTDLEQIAKALGGAHRNQDGSWSARCPAHEDENPSLSLSRRNGKILWYCHAGCSQDAVTTALRSQGLIPERGNGAAGPATTKKASGGWHAAIPVPDGAPEPAFTHAKHGKPSAAWTYRDGAGRILFYTVRFDLQDGNKEILPRCYGTLKGKIGWHWKAPPEPRQLYRLNKLETRPADTPVLLVEGEKTACAAAELFHDHVAMTWQGGSKAVAKADWSPLQGRDVVIWPDADDPGRKAARTVARHVPALKVVDVPTDLPDGWDLADPPPDGLDLRALLESAKELTPEQLAEDKLTEDLIALRFAERHGDQLRFDHHSGSWHVWDGDRWRREETRLAFDWTRTLIRELNVDGKPALARTTAAAGVERFAQADRAFAVTSETWEPDQFRFALPTKEPAK